MPRGRPEGLSGGTGAHSLPAVLSQRLLVVVLPTRAGPLALSVSRFPGLARPREAVIPQSNDEAARASAGGRGCSR